MGESIFILFLLFGLSGCLSMSPSTADIAMVDRALDMDTAQASIINEHFYAIYCEGKKIGWRKLSEARLMHSGQIYQIHTQITCKKYYRYGQPVEKTQLTKTIHDMQNHFVAGATLSSGGNQKPTLVTIRNTGPDLQVSMERGETRSNRKIKRQVSNLYPLIQQIRMLPLLADAQKEIHFFSTNKLRLYAFTAKVLGIESLELDTGARPAWHVVLKRHQRVLQDFFISPDGKQRVLKIVDHLQPYSYVAEPSYRAKHGIETYDFNTMHDIKPSTSIASSWSVQTAIMDISNKALNDRLIENTWQVREENFEDGRARWIFQARKVDDQQAQNLPLSFKSTPEFLGSSFYIQSNHPKIRQTAALIKGAETNALRLFRKIAMWVYNAIEEKNYNTEMASAVEVLERKQGDCTEHSVLTVALARASGIPARIAAGLYYTEESFTYHMWVEAMVGEDLWVAVDPAMGQIEPDALHLKLFHGDLDYDTHSNITWDLIESLHRDDLKIVKINKTF